MPGRTYSSEAYSWGFQGQEKDDEISGMGNSISYTYRIHDPRIGRFFGVDPLTDDYPYFSPYQFSGNRVIDKIELEGLEPTEPPTKGNEDQVVSAQYIGNPISLNAHLDQDDIGKTFDWMWDGDNYCPVNAYEYSYPNSNPSSQNTDDELGLIINVINMPIAGAEVVVDFYSKTFYLNSQGTKSLIQHMGRTPKDIKINYTPFKKTPFKSSLTFSNSLDGLSKVNLAFDIISVGNNLANEKYAAATVDGVLAVATLYNPEIGFIILTLQVAEEMSMNDPNCPGCSVKLIKDKMSNADLEERKNYYEKLKKKSPNEAERYNNILYIETPKPQFLSAPSGQ